jgi:DNA-directed RNA polymerase subunit alpha
MIQIKRPHMLYVKDSGDVSKGRFIVEPLERGFGVTLGNSLRRVLLSSLPGAAVTAVNIQDVLHEFSTIPGVVEDVTDILLNLKQLIVKLDGEESVTLKLDKQGPCVVTAGDLVLPPGVEIINKDLHIAELNEDGKLIMEVMVEYGRGYLRSEDNVRPEYTFNTLVMDAAFSPVKQVKYYVEDTRVGQDINYDRLILELETNGAILPDEATRLASKFLVEHLGLFVNYVEEQQELIEMVSEEKETVNQNVDIPIKDIEFSVRSRNCLKRTDIKTIGDLASKTAAELLSIKNFGMKSLNEVKDKLAQFGLSLRDETIPTDDK